MYFRLPNGSRRIFRVYQFAATHVPADTSLGRDVLSNNGIVRIAQLS
jgi:hypothetical protein